MRSPERSDIALAFVGVSVVIAGVLGGAAVPVLAGDFPGLLEFTPDEIDAESGDTIEVDIRMNSDGTYTDAGIDRVAVTVAYDPAALEVLDVQRGPWLDQGNETTITSEMNIDNDAGQVTIEQAREPPDGGATGDDLLAHLDIQVREDAPARDALLVFAETEIRLTDGSYQAPFIYDGIVMIDGGGEILDPLANDTDGDDDPGVTLAEDDDETDDGDSTDADEEGPLPGFGVLVAIVAILILVLRNR